MATRLDKSLKRELEVNGELCMLTISPEGLKLVPKGKRKVTTHMEGSHKRTDGACSSTECLTGADAWLTVTPHFSAYSAICKNDSALVAKLANK